MVWIAVSVMVSRKNRVMKMKLKRLEVEFGYSRNSFLFIHFFVYFPAYSGPQPMRFEYCLCFIVLLSMVFSMFL